MIIIMIIIMIMIITMIIIMIIMMMIIIIINYITYMAIVNENLTRVQSSCQNRARRSVPEKCALEQFANRTFAIAEEFSQSDRHSHNSRTQVIIIIILILLLLLLLLL